MSQPTFPERTALLREAAHQMRAASETVLAEVQRMEAAQQRFSQRRPRAQKAGR